MDEKKKVSGAAWELAARRELQNILDFLAVAETGYMRRQDILCERIRELLATESE